jgi:type II secretory pathway pseudopilin PulG
VIFMKKAESGCTLIEALVALSILAVGIMFFVQASLFSLKSAGAARRDTRSLAVAVEWIELLRERTWEGSVGGCERESLPEEKLETALCRIERGGETYRLSMEKSLRDPLVAHLTVQCTGTLPGDRTVFIETAVEEGR